jgi:general secretion pathway protein H
MKRKQRPALLAESKIRQFSSFQHGFTLLELLVVVVIVAIMFTYTTLAIRGESPEDMIKQEAQRLERLIQLAMEESILRGEEYALEFYPDSYQFLRFEQNSWRQLSGDKILRKRELPHEMELELRLEETEIVMSFGSEKSQDLDEKDSDENEKVKPEPQIYILSSGEITPEFDVRFYILGIDASYFVKASFDGSVKTELSDL